MKQTPALFPPGWLDDISKDPERARKELTRTALEVRKFSADLGEVSEEKDRLRRRLKRKETEYTIHIGSLQDELQREQGTTHARKRTLEETTKQRDDYKFQAAIEARKAFQARQSLSEEKDRTASLELRVRKLEQTIERAEAQRGTGERLVSAIEKIAKKKACGKRLAAAVHPDKFLPECSELATELFQFVQSKRGQSDEIKI